MASYENLLDIFWRLIDPMDERGQFYDRGPSYMTVIFYYDEEQKKMAEASREALQASGRFPKPIVTKILSATAFILQRSITKSITEKIILDIRCITWDQEEKNL